MKEVIVAQSWNELTRSDNFINILTNRGSKFTTFLAAVTGACEKRDFNVI